MNKDKQLKDVLSTEVVGVAPRAPAMDALKLMREHGISCVVALEDSRPVGIITERTVLSRVAHGLDRLAGLDVAGLMSSPVVVLDHGKRLFEAYGLLKERNLRHLVVVDDQGRAVGVVTQSDLVEQLGLDYLSDIKIISEIMNPLVLTVPGATTVARSLEIMAEKSVSCLVVSDNGGTDGIFSERDVVRCLVEDACGPDTPVSEVMSSPVLTVPRDRPAIEVALYMKREGIRRLVVAGENGEVLGVVTQTDILRTLESRYILTLRRYLMDKDAMLEEVGRTLAEKTVFLESILRSSTDMAIVAAGPDYKINYYNPAARSIFGIGPELVLGRDCRKLAVPAMGVDRKTVDAALDSLTPEYSHPFDFIRSNGGESRVYSARVAGVWGGMGELAGYVLLFRDVTDEVRDRDRLDQLNRRLEQMVVERTRDLTRKAGELAGANERLRNMDELKTSFLSSVSHELRTPLTSLLGFAKLISKDFDRHFLSMEPEGPRRTKGERIRKNLDIILGEGDRLTRLTDDFLDLSKIESGRMPWHDQKVDMGTMVRKAASAFMPLFQSKPQVELRVDVQPDVPEIMADPDRLEQVLINLLDNAFKYTHEGQVLVEVKKSGGQGSGKTGVEVRVQDTGEGISAMELDHVFDKFHQAPAGDTLGKKPRGTGLGLAICREIVEHYQGRIQVESESGTGSAFTIFLPLGHGHPADTGYGRPVGDPLAPLVLVVDDDPAVCTYLLQVFEAEGYRVVAVRDGATALKAARELEPDLITMDLLMPGMGGREAIRRLGEDPATSSVPVLVISVLPPEGDAGGDAVLAKPIDEMALLETVAGLLTRRDRKRLVPTLKSGYGLTPGQCFTLLSGEIDCCDETRLWERLEEGFKGTVILPDWAVGQVDLERLRSRSGVQILLLPSQGDVS